jgi:hypothetical protein
VDVQAAARGDGEHRGGKNESIGRDDEDVGPGFAQALRRLALLERCGFQGCNCVALRSLRDRAGGELQPAPRGAIGLGEHQRDIMPGCDERLQRTFGERRGSGEGDAQRREGGPQAALRWRFLSFARTRFCFSSER